MPTHKDNIKAQTSTERKLPGLLQPANRNEEVYKHSCKKQSLLGYCYVYKMACTGQLDAQSAQCSRMEAL